MKTVKYFSMVALIVMGAILASCESIEQNVVPVVEDNIVVCKFTVSIGTDETKALDPTTRNKTFAAGEQIAVIYKNTNTGEGETVTVLSEALPAGDYGDNATFTVTLTNPKPGSAVRYIYPAAMLAPSVATDSDVNSDANVNYAALETQDGTLATLGSNLDLAIFDGTLTSEGALPAAEASLINKFAILAITLKDNAETPAEITGDITGMTISDGTNTYVVSRETSTGPIYVAIRPTASASFNITATDGTKNYVKTLTGKTYAASNGYNVSWRMGQLISLAGLTGDYVARDGDVLTGELDVVNYPVKISIAAGATVTLAGVTIEGVNDDSYSWAGINCIGDATIILADGTTNTVRGFYEDYPGIWARVGFTVTINGTTGSLDASSNGYGAGIGGGYNSYSGNIIIEGGNITATGGAYCAGIGAGGYQGGDITIRGGNITATGGKAGIGAGDAPIGDITITGGEINATGYEGGAGIGGGYDAACGSIIISGGTIIASSDENGAGIGSGMQGTCDDITISGGIITATGGESGAGIGAGDMGTCGKITISDGSIAATGGNDGAGIGIGNDAECGNISISGGTIEATGIRNGAGIGCSGQGECGTIEISSTVSQVTATKGSNSTHSIGFGLKEGSESYITCGAVTIGGTVYWNGSTYESGGDAYLSTSPFIYAP